MVTEHFHEKNLTTMSKTVSSISQIISKCKKNFNLQESTNISKEVKQT